MNEGMNPIEYRLRGRLEMRVRDADGREVASRSASNMVLRNGAALIARLFTGQPGAAPINRLQLGFATEVGGTELRALTPPDPPVDPAALRSVINPADFQVDLTGPDSVKVSVSALFTPAIELRDVTEAGLLAGDELYNQVVFEPLTLLAGQNITFFWQVVFPFGH